VNNLVLNELKLDYLTATSNDTELVLDEWTTHRARILQYVGFAHSDNRIFEGLALQQGKLNRLCRLSSHRANELWELCVGMRATRLDLALDVLTENTFAEDLNCWSIVSSRASTFISTHEKNKSRGFTLYVGSRKSERFLRVYDKSVEGNLDYPGVVRFELELKGSLARRVFRMIEEYGLSSPMQCVFRDEIYRLLKGVELERIGWFLGDRTPMTVVSEEKDHSAYLINQVKKMLLSDQRKGYHNEVREIIKACLLNFGVDDNIYTVADVLELLAERTENDKVSEEYEMLYERVKARNGQF